jgi:hypothetical protein
VHLVVNDELSDVIRNEELQLHRIVIAKSSEALLFFLSAPYHACLGGSLHPTNLQRDLYFLVSSAMTSIVR